MSADNCCMTIEEKVETEEKVLGEAPTADTKLVNIAINDDNVAFNVMISFVNLAQRRGAFSIDESAKIWECVKRFQRTSSDTKDDRR